MDELVRAHAENRRRQLRILVIQAVSLELNKKKETVATQGGATASEVSLMLILNNINDFAANYKVMVNERDEK